MNGNNMVHRSKNMDWYHGAPPLYTLESLHVSSAINKADARFPVQTVLRPRCEGFMTYRSYAERIASGVLRINDNVTVMPSSFTSKIKTIIGPS